MTDDRFTIAVNYFSQSDYPPRVGLGVRTEAI